MFSENFISWFLFKVFDYCDTKVNANKHIKELHKMLNKFIINKIENLKDSFGVDELDFQRIEEYIMENLYDDAMSYFRGTGQQRQQAEESIMSKAVYYASANSPKSKAVIESIIKECLQIINEYYCGQIDTVTRINTNLAVNEVVEKIDHDTQDIKKSIENIPDKLKSTNETAYSRKLDILKILEKYELPDFILDICPRRKFANNEKISQAEMNVLFKTDSEVLNDYSLLLSLINEMQNLVSELFSFYHRYSESDGYGGWNNDVWDTILNYEKLLVQADCTDDIVEEFEKYCNSNTCVEYISEIDEYIEYNYYSINARMSEIRTNFSDVKNRLITRIVNTF